MFFDDDLIDAMRAAPNPDDDDDVGAGSHAHENSNDEEADENLVSEEETKTDDLEVEPETASMKGQDDKKASATPEVATSSAGQSRRRRRGSRGGASGSSQVGGNSVVNKRWRSGQIPAAPIFEGDIEADPYCLRHYKRRLTRWVMITKEYLPANEQALRAREQLRGEAELELEETPDSRYDDPDGINKLLADLEQSFGERELFRQGGVIREFESISRLQGESVTQFVRRFRLLERKLQDNRVPEYPQEARVIKLLDGLRLDDRATSALLLAAGNRYDMKLIQEAIRIQYPPGMSVTGIPKGQQQKRGKGGQKWNALQTAWEADEEDDYGWDWSWENDYNQFLTYDQFDEYEYDHEYDPDVNYNQDDVDYEYDGTGENHDHSTQSTADANSSENTATESSMFPTLLNAVNALTVTSKRLADITRARGFYNSKGSGGKHGGKSKGKSGSKSKGGGHGGKFGKGGGKNGKDKGSSTSGGGKSKGKFSGKGKPSQTPSKINLQHQQQRLQDATCLGCGSPDHWINDCPKMNRFSAQIATAAAGVVMDAEGNPQASSWMTSVGEKNFQLPAIVVDEVKNEFHHDQAKQDTLEDSPPTTGYEVIPSNPEVLIQYANQDACLMIADTGCQRQVAGRSWHNQRQQEISPLQPLRCPERCTFSFGPNEGVPSRERYVYPAGLGGVFVSLGISVVDSNAPALFSRPAFTKLGAIPNLVEGKMYYQALQTESKLYLSPCGHLAIRIDEWPSEFAWPPLVNEDEKSDDVWSPDAVVLEPVALQHPVTSARSPPHAISSSISGYSSMAAQLEADDEPCSRIRVLGPSSSVMFYASTAMKPSLRDRILRVCFPPQTATTMLMSTTVLTLQSKTGTDKYPNDPRSCRHPSGLRGYGAAGEKISICDMCGMRWLRGTGNDPGMIQCQPKASPSAKTPLFKKGSDMDKIIGARRASRLNANSSSGSSPPSWPPPASSMLNQEVDQSVRSSKAKSKAVPKFPGAPPIAPTAKPRLAGMSEQEIIEMQAELLSLQRQRAQNMDVEEENWDDWDEEDPQAWFHRSNDFPEGYEVPPLPEEDQEDEF